jgi:hypothetical protein
MRPFHMAHVSPLQCRVRAASHIWQGVCEFGTPAQFRPCRHGHADQVGGCQPARARAGKPRHRFLRIASQLCEIEGGLFDARSGRESRGMTGHADSRASMDDDARHTASRLQRGDGNLLRRTNRHVDQPRGLVNNPVEFGSCAMTQHCPGPGSEDCAAENCGPRRAACVRGVDAAVQRLPAATAEFVVDGRKGQSGLDRLPAGDDAMLEFKQFLVRDRSMNGHSQTVTRRRRPGTGANSCCGQSVRRRVLVDGLR